MRLTCAVAVVLAAVVAVPGLAADGSVGDDRIEKYRLGNENSSGTTKGATEDVNGSQWAQQALALHSDVRMRDCLIRSGSPLVLEYHGLRRRDLRNSETYGPKLTYLSVCGLAINDAAFDLISTFKRGGALPQPSTEKAKASVAKINIDKIYKEAERMVIENGIGDPTFSANDISWPLLGTSIVFHVKNSDLSYDLGSAIWFDNQTINGRHFVYKSDVQDSTSTKESKDSPMLRRKGKQ